MTSAAAPVVRTVNLQKIYQNAGVPVPAVRGVDLTDRRGRVRRHHGAVRVGQIHR